MPWGHDVYLLSRHGTASESLPIDTVAGWGAGSLTRIRSWVRDRQLDIVNLQFQDRGLRHVTLHTISLPKVISVPVITTFHDLRHPYSLPKRRSTAPVDCISACAYISGSHHHQSRRRSSLASVHPPPHDSPSAAASPAWTAHSASGRITDNEQALMTTASSWDTSASSNQSKVCTIF